MSQPFTAWNLAPVIGTPLRKKGFGWSDYGALLDYKVFISAVGLVDFKLALIQGLQGGGQVLDSNFATLTAQVPGMNGALVNPSIRPRDGLIQNENFSLGDNNGNLAKVLKFSDRPISLNLIVGASLYTGKWDDNAQFDITMYGFFGDYNSRNWGLKGEWGRADVEQASGVNPVPLPGPPPINLSVGNYSIKAWYLEAYRTLIRYGKSEEKQVNFIVRRDQVNTNSKVAFNPFDRSRWTVGSEWTFLKNVRARFEWQNSRIRDFKRAPGPFVASGGKKRVRMRMFSLIGYF